MSPRRMRGVQASQTEGLGSGRSTDAWVLRLGFGR